MSITITEALAEIKTIDKRLDKRREQVATNLARQDGIKDPFEKEGGAEEYIKRERQGIADLEERKVALRLGIARANDATEVTVCGKTRTISAWIVWRREVSGGQKRFLGSLNAGVTQVRTKARQSGVQVLKQGDDAQQPQDYVLHIDQAALAAEIEQFENILGTLDGVLSMVNATTPIVE